MLQLLIWAPFVFAVSVLTGAAIFDVKKREVPNWIWLLSYPIGCIMTIAKLAINLLDVQTVLISLVITLFLGAILLYTGYYGSADVKALVFVGLTLPMLPPTFTSTVDIPMLPLVLVMFCNSTILSMIWPLSIFILNLKDTLQKKSLFEGITLSMREKVLLIFTTRRMPLEELETKHLRYFPAETVELQEDTPTRKMLHLLKAETNPTKYLNQLNKHRELYKKGILVSPTIPSITLFTLALAITPLGNIIFWIIILFGTL